MTMAARRTKKQPPRPPRNKGAGRPPTLLVEPQVQDKLAEQIRRGTPIAHACRALGLGEGTYHQWIAMADVDGPYRDLYAKFREEMGRARADKVNMLLERLHQAGAIPNNKTGQLDPRPTIWLLEKTEPEDYGWKREKLELTGAGGGAVKVEQAIEVRSWADIALAAEAEERKLRESEKPRELGDGDVVDVEVEKSDGEA